MSGPPPYLVVETRRDTYDLSQRGVRHPSSVCVVTRYIKDISQRDHTTNASIPLHSNREAFTAEEMCQVPLQYAIDCHEQLSVWVLESEVNFWGNLMRRARSLIQQRVVSIGGYEEDGSGLANVKEGVVEANTDPFVVW